MQAFCRKVLTFHWLATFILTGVFSALGALASLNIFMMLSANFRFLSEIGVMAVMEGAVVQLGQLVCRVSSPWPCISASKPASVCWSKNC